MLERHATQGRIDALRRFGFEKAAMELGPAGIAAAPPSPAGVATSPGMMDRVRSFAGGQMGAAKDLFSNLRQGLGGAGTPELGAAARAGAVGNLKTLAPSLLAGGGLYMLHRHNQAQRDAEARQRAAMMGGGYPMV